MIKFIKKYLKYFLIFLVASSLFLLVNNSPKKITTIKEEKLAISKKETNKENQENVNTVFVDVKGAVNNPGVYELESTKRVIDAIDKAGGLNDKADTINLNLSMKLKDEMIIIVYTKTEISVYAKNNNGSKNATCASLECNCNDDFNNACISNSETSSKTLKSSTSENTTKKSTGKISINTATKQELTTLTGIGDAKAEKIIKYREENGAFKQIEDIKNVSGIGDSIYEKIKDNITL